MTDDDAGKPHGPQWGWKRKAASFGGPPFMRKWMEGGMAGGPPFGPFAGRGQRGPRMFGQGDLRLLLLALIADKPSHGYDLIRTIESKFQGNYVPSPGTIYPTLTLLEEQELIASTTDLGSTKKSYSATLTGRQMLAENAEHVKALMARIDIMAGGAESHGPPESIVHAIHTLRYAIMAKQGGWEKPEQTRVRMILEEAAKRILEPK
jgi:DNA-binding PadR family transcriptional regulator